MTDATRTSLSNHAGDTDRTISSTDLPPTPDSFNSFYQEFVGEPIEHKAQTRQLYLPQSLTKTAIAGAGGIAATLVVGFSLSNDATTQSTFTFREPPPQSSMGLEAQSPAATQQAVTPVPAAVEFSRSKVAQVPVSVRVPRASAGTATPKLPIPTPTAQAVPVQTAAAQAASEPPSSNPERMASRDLSRSNAAGTLPSLSITPLITPPALAGVAPPETQQSIPSIAAAPMVFDRALPIATAVPIVPSSSDRAISAPESPQQLPVNRVGAETFEKGQNNLQGIRYFIDRSKQTPEVSKANLLPLTDRAAIEVAKADNAGTFRVLHPPQSEYLRIWSVVSNSRESLPMPAHGFIDYQRQVIVIPAERYRNSA